MRNEVLLLLFIIVFSLNCNSNVIVESSSSKLATDALYVIYPHTSEYANWVFTDFESWYKTKTGNDINVYSIQKDSTAAEAEVASWNGTSPGADIIWGGGIYNFELLRYNPGLNLLEPYQVVEYANYSATFNGWDLYEPQTGTPCWYASAIDGYGFMYNTEYLTAHNLPTPQTWSDLTNYSYFSHIVMADPSASGVTTATVNQLLQYMNTDNGKSAITLSSNMTEAWQFWDKLAGNVGQFTTSSSQVPQLVANGQFGIGITIDYYSWEKSEAGYPVEFTYGGATTASPDPVAIIHNSAHLSQAQYFMDYITSTRGQSRVGSYRVPVNFKATTPVDGPVKRAFFDNGTPNLAGFPLIIPYNVSIEGMIFGRARSLFTNWFVINTNDQTSAWTTINKASGDKKAQALAIYLRLPDGFDGTIGGLLSLNYHDNSVTDGWSLNGSNNFILAESIASEGISINTTGPELSTSLQTTTQDETTTQAETSFSDSTKITQAPGFEFFLLISFLIAFSLIKRKGIIHRK